MASLQLFKSIENTSDCNPIENLWDYLDKNVRENSAELT